MSIRSIMPICVILYTVNSNILTASQNAQKIERTIGSIRQCVLLDPTGWPQTWQQDYIHSIGTLLTNGKNSDNLTDRLLALEKGFPLYWARKNKSGCHKIKFKVDKAEVQWYVEHLLANRLTLSETYQERCVQFEELYSHALACLKEQFSELDAKVAKAAYVDTIRDTQLIIEAPLNPLFAKIYTENQRVKAKQEWQRKSMSRLRLWKQLSCKLFTSYGSIRYNRDIEMHPHYIFVRRCLRSIQISLGNVGLSPPIYYQTALKEYQIRMRTQLKEDRKKQRHEKTLTSTRIAQVERLSFMYCALMETTACLDLSDTNISLHMPTIVTDGSKALAANRTCASSFDFHVQWASDDPFLFDDLDGVFVWDGKDGYRLSVYWASPVTLLRSSDILTYCDILVKEGHAYIWLHDQGLQRLSPKDLNRPFRLPGKGNLSDVMRSVLVALQHVNSDKKAENAVWYMARFFKNARRHKNLTYEIPGYDNSSLLDETRTDTELFNHMPMKRTYRKRVVEPDTVIWEVQRGCTRRRIASVTIRALSKTVCSPLTFDINNLGSWSLIPEPHRIYWELETRFSATENTKPVKLSNVKQLCTEAKICLKKGWPKQVQFGLARLYFEMALKSGDIAIALEATEQCLQYHTKSHQVLGSYATIELGTLVNHLRKHFSDTSLENGIEQLVKDYLSTILQNEDHLTAIIEYVQAKHWFWYGRILLKTAEDVEGIDLDRIRVISHQLEIDHLANYKVQAGPQENTQSSALIVEKIDTMQPPLGTLEIKDLQEILREGLNERFADMQADSLNKVVTEVTDLIQRLAGKGPFVGNRRRLLQSIKRCQHFYKMSKTLSSNLAASLASLMVVSFYDRSTKADHDRLFSQLLEISNHTCNEVLGVLKTLGLHDLLTENEIRAMLNIIERHYKSYIRDPLKPMYKYALTDNEYSRCLNEMRCYLYRIKPQLMACRNERACGTNIKFIKKKLSILVTNLTQDLIPNSAFLRLPQYPGMRCTYQGSRGLYIRIHPEVFQYNNTDREVVTILKYFLVGNRIQATIDHICKNACNRIS